MDPMFARCILLSNEMGCTEEILGIIAMVSCDATVFLNPSNAKEESNEAHKRFFSAYGDHQTLLTTFSLWKSIPKQQKKQWCKDNFISMRALSKAMDIYKQLSGQLKSLGVSVMSCEDPMAIRKALVTGLFPHAAKRQHNGYYKIIATGLEVKIHPTSVLHGKVPNCIVFNEVVRTTRQYVRGVTSIESSWLPEIAPSFFARQAANATS